MAHPTHDDPIPELALRLRILYVLRDGPVGRRRVASLAGLSEMVARQAIERMRDIGWVRVEKAGASLGDSCEPALSDLFSRIIAIRSLDLAILGDDEPRPAAHVRMSASQPAWQLRDRCLMFGGTGMILLVRSGGAWRFSHDGEGFAERNPRDADRIHDAFPLPMEGDLLLVISAPDAHRAASALWGALVAVLRAEDRPGIV